MNKNLISCQFCQKNNLYEAYHDKQGFTYCAECYWEKDEYTKKIAKKRSWDFYAETNVYKSCPYCGSGDTCIEENNGQVRCISKHCGFFHPEDSKGCGCWERKKTRRARKREPTRGMENQQQRNQTTWSMSQNCRKNPFSTPKK